MAQKKPKREIVIDSADIEVVIPELMKHIKEGSPKARLRGWILMSDGVLNLIHDQGEGSGPSTFTGFCGDCWRMMAMELHAKECRRAQRAVKKASKKGKVS